MKKAAFVILALVCAVGAGICVYLTGSLLSALFCLPWILSAGWMDRSVKHNRKPKE